MSTSHHSIINTNVNSTGHKEEMVQVCWAILEIIITNAMILLVGPLQITKDCHAPSIHMSLLEMEFVQNKGCSKLIRLLMLGGGIMNQSTIVVLVEKEDQRQQLRLHRNGTYVIMDITT
jgi:hypothetical protein